jgi:hypothetical protein
MTDILLKHRLLALASTNATVVAAGKQRLVGGIVSNTSAAIKYLKFYDKATAPTVGTDTPVMTIALPATSNTPVNSFATDIGVYFTLGFTYALTGAQADTDTTALTAGDVVVNFLYNNG